MTRPADPGRGGGAEAPDARRELAPSDGGDARWIASVARHYGPAPLDAVGRARFDARLRERLEASGSSPASGAGRRLAPAFAALAVAGAVAWSLLGGVGGEPAPADEAAVVAWEWDLLLAGERWSEPTGDEAELPDEYVAIADAFLVY
jgi:hypothetical protein